MYQTKYLIQRLERLEELIEQPSLKCKSPEWKWSRDKQEWYFCNPANKSRKFGKDRKAWDKSQIRNHYGSKFYRQEEKYQQIA